MLDASELPDKAMDRALMLERIMLAWCEGKRTDEHVYQHLRYEFMADPTTKRLLPSFVVTCRTVGAFWSFIKDQSDKWEPRRRIVRDGFRPFLDQLEGRSHNPSVTLISAVLQTFDVEGVHHAWEKALTRCQQDPDGAITAARSLLETVCIQILEDAQVQLTGKEDLPKLYGLAANILNLAPSNHTEQAFKTILGACQSIVNSLAEVRNKVGDAHGKGRRTIRPTARHATLAVTLAGGMATFLVETAAARKSG